jgi:hypothetical protein
MFKITTLARKALMAVALVFSCGAALAFPSYEVTIHTQAYSGESGLLDFSFGGNADAPVGIATLWNMTGDFGAEFDRAGFVLGAIPSPSPTFTSGAASTYLTQSVVFGGDFVFNIVFSGPIQFMNSPSGLTFAVGLYDAGMTEQWDIPVPFELTPAFNGAAASLAVTTNPDSAEVRDLSVQVPEPSQLLLMLSALALAGVALRRSRQA